MHHVQGKNATVAVSISWDWIHYLVEDDVVNYSFRGKEDDRKVTTEIKAVQALSVRDLCTRRSKTRTGVVF